MCFPACCVCTKGSVPVLQELLQASWAPRSGPGGCLGYAFNLVRPSREGHRAALLVGLLSQTLVFETLQQASDYREYVTQVSEGFQIISVR